MDCDAPAADWSYIGGDPNELIDHRGIAYSLNLDLYIPRCKSCHKKHDLNQAATK